MDFDPTIMAIAKHEASDVVAAQRLLVEVVNISIDPANPHVKTRFRSGSTAGEQIDGLRRQAIVALAGTITDRNEHSILDTENALRYCEQISAGELRHGIEADGASLPSHRVEGAKICSRNSRIERPDCRKKLESNPSPCRRTGERW